MYMYNRQELFAASKVWGLSITIQHLSIPSNVYPLSQRSAEITRKLRKNENARTWLTIYRIYLYEI